ncbi:phage shock protein E [Gammaproteobacteria bacterium]
MEQFTQFFLHHWELFLVLGVILGMLFGEPLLRGTRGYQGVGPLEATGLISHQNALVLDVREENEFKEGHVLNSIHIPAGKLSDRGKELEKHRERPVIVVCQSGNRSGRASSFLHKQGFSSIYNLDGGLVAWRSANLPLTQKR